MKTKLSALLMSVPVVFGVIGCGSGTPQATEEQKKSFAGGPPPANYMDQVNTKPKSSPPAGDQTGQ